MRFSTRFPPAALAVLLGVACSQPQPQRCTPGKAELCGCSGARQGVQVCDAEGLSFSACDCAGSSGGGTAGGTTGGGTAGGAAVCQLPCGQNGQCIYAAAGATCACNPGYGGLLCTQCATGFQDNDGNGTCLPTCATLGLTCSGRGSCTEQSGTATCTCASAYTGLNCASCAAGFQDNDGDGTCRPACSASTCSGHGTCVDTTGQTACTCATGFTGSSCSTCAAGFQDNDGNGSCAPACTTSTCSGHGTCADSSGTATCSCAMGHGGATCSTCAASFQDNDGNGSCLPACSTSTCNGHGTCADSTGSATCSCATGYTGASCATCTSGFQDNDGNGSCLSSCATTTCASNAFCRDDVGAASCVCHTGYSALADGGAGCLWSGGLRDPALIDSPAGQWQVDGGWQWNPNDGGVLRFTMCASQGSFVQRNVVMPPASTEPLAMLMSFQGGASGNQGISAKVGQSVVMTDLLQAFGQTRAFCLGEGAMTDGPTTVEVRTSSIEPGICFDQTVMLDQVELVPARTLCPAIGTVTNGDFEGAGGWLLSTGASVVAGAVDSSRGLRLSMATECDQVSGVTTFSAPLASTLPNGALRFKVRGTSGSVLDVASGPSLSTTARLARLPVVTSVVSHTLCLPSALLGNVATVLFSLRHVGGAASCGAPELRTVELDDVQLVSDPACTGGEVLNPGFESANDGAPWSSGVSVPAFASARVVIDSFQARSGWAFFRATTGPCYGSSTEQLIKVPAVSASGAGPAVRFFYRRSGSAGTANARFSIGSFFWATDQSLPTALNWTRAVVCLPSSRAGLPVSMVFSQYGGPGTCGSAATVERLDVDDVEVTTDSSCPP